MAKNKVFSAYLGIFVFTLSVIFILTKDTVFAEPVTEESNHKNIYLTFDDGPSNIVTNKILDVLAEKKVKATFFVIGDKIQGREEILKRIYSEGHSIGVHTYTHKYRKIYSSEKAFIDEMDQASKEVERVVGITPHAIRFPTGSKNHLTEHLLQELHNCNYKIYDWNASLPDGIDYNASENRLIKESRKVVGKSPSRIILLLHCDQTNKNTAKALPVIIDYYREQGYEFKAITDETPELYFRFKRKT